MSLTDLFYFLLGTLVSFIKFGVMYYCTVTTLKLYSIYYFVYLFVSYLNLLKLLNLYCVLILLFLTSTFWIAVCVLEVPNRATRIQLNLPWLLFSCRISLCKISCRPLSSDGTLNETLYFTFIINTFFVAAKHVLHQE